MGYSKKNSIKATFYCSFQIHSERNIRNNRTKVINLSSDRVKLTELLFSKINSLYFYILIDKYNLQQWCTQGGRGRSPLRKKKRKGKKGEKGREKGKRKKGGRKKEKMRKEREKGEKGRENEKKIAETLKI